MYFQTFSEVCTHYFQCFGECAHPFHGHFLRVRRFFWLLLKCAQLSTLPPRIPGSGFRVLAGGSSCWRAVTLIPQTFSLNTGDPAQPGAPISRAGPVEARPGGAVPG